jgi:uroporphyrinogen-III synthase
MSIYLLSESRYEEVINLALIKSTCKEIALDLKSYEALIFSSKNAVKAIDKINKNWRKIPSFCIGEATAHEVKSLGGIVRYVAQSSYGDDFALELIEKLQNKKTIFLRAKIVLSSLEKILVDAGIDLDSKVIYETTCKDDNLVKELEKNSIIIFTSPSTLKCFFKHFSWDNSYKAVCIGKVTAQALPSNISPYISETQSIASCIDLAKTLIKQN